MGLRSREAGVRLQKLCRYTVGRRPVRSRNGRRIGGEWWSDGVLHRRGLASNRSGSSDPAVMGARASHQAPPHGSGISDLRGDRRGAAAQDQAAQEGRGPELRGHTQAAGHRRRGASRGRSRGSAERCGRATAAAAHPGAQDAQRGRAGHGALHLVHLGARARRLGGVGRVATTAGGGLRGHHAGAFRRRSGAELSARAGRRSTRNAVGQRRALRGDGVRREGHGPLLHPGTAGRWERGFLLPQRRGVRVRDLRRPLRRTQGLRHLPGCAGGHALLLLDDPAPLVGRRRARRGGLRQHPAHFLVPALVVTPHHLEALLSVPVLCAPMVSPDGRWVAWSWSRLGPAADVFAAPTDGSARPIRLTETADDTLVVSWTPDSRAVVVEQDRDGDERMRLYLVRIAQPGVMEPLTEASPNYYVRGGQVHRDRRWLIYGANLDAESRDEIEGTWIYRHDLENGERKALARPEKGNYHAPQLNIPGDTILYHRNDLDPAGLQVWLVDVEGRNDREILNFGLRTKTYASWFPDGRRVLFVVEAQSHRRLGVWEDGSVRWLLDDARRDIEYAFVPPNGGPVVVAEVERARIRATLLDAESGAEEERPSSASGSLIPLSPTDGGGWIGLHYSARHPVDLVRFDPTEVDKTPISLTGLWERVPLDPKSLVPAEDLSWRSVDGLEVQGWLYRTPRRGAGTIVLVHGGPTSCAEDRFNAQIQYLVSRGFDVLAPNYRGSTGFGLQFQESIKEDGWGGREQKDVRTGIEALVRAGVAEPGRVGVTGTSYGGYSAWWAITHFSPDLVAAAPICGMTDLVVDYYATRPDLRPYSEEMMGGSPEDVPERYRERSPVNFVRNIRGGLLIVQGLRDPNVTPDNLHAVTKALDKHNVPYELLTFEDEGHGIARPKNLEVLYPRLAAFFERAFSQAR